MNNKKEIEIKYDEILKQYKKSLEKYKPTAIPLALDGG